jgi:LPS-assembly protein
LLSKEERGFAENTGVARIVKSVTGKANPICRCCQSHANRVSSKTTCFCYAEPYTGLGLGMRPRNLVFITLLTLCHLQLGAQTLTNGLPMPPQDPAGAVAPAADNPAKQLPDDPGQEALPVAEPEPAPATGVPVQWEAQRQNWAGDTLTLSGDVVFRYRDYVLRADKVIYHRSTSELDAEGHLQVAGGPTDVLINASHGDMRLNMHTARFYNVSGSQGVRMAGRSTVYSTANPFLFSGRVLLQLGEGNYRVIDGSMTNCRLPRPDWRLISRAINLANGEASMSNTVFKFLGVPLFYLPYVRHPVDETGRESGFLIPVISNSTIKGFTMGEQVYWVINRSMDMIVGSEYYSKRGWAPNGDFRYKGPGLDHLTARWNALLDRGVEQSVGASSQGSASRPGAHAAAPAGMQLVNQGGEDVVALGRKDLSPDTRIAGNIEYLSSYIYRLVFNDNYTQAVSSEVASDLSLTHAHNGFISSASMGRFQTFASSAVGDEARVLHLPNLRFDVLDRKLGVSPLYWGLASSLGFLGRSEPLFHARNIGRIDVYPHLVLPINAGGWSVVPETALRGTFYSISQVPDLTGAKSGIPSVSHDPLQRVDFEASVDIRAPAFERDFAPTSWNRLLLHVIEPEFYYRYVGGIGAAARNAILIDTTDIATNTNEVGFSLTQRLYLRPIGQQHCVPEETQSSGACSPSAREWASWQIAQKFFIDPNFGGALITNRRNVFNATLDMSGVAFLTSPRNLAPVTSRLRFEAINNLRIQWDLDYDPNGGRLDADNVFAGYSWGRTTVGLGHALLNAVDEKGSTASTIQSEQVNPFLSIGKPSGAGFNLAANGGYDFVHGSLQYGGAQVVYNWNCCGLSVGYRRFALGAVREETQYLYSFTLANFGSVGDIRRSNSVFRDSNLPPAY